MNEKENNEILKENIENSEQENENKDYQLLEPKVILSDNTEIESKSTSLYLNSVTFEEYGVTYYYAHNHLYPSFPFNINDAIIQKICILGDDVEPCFEGASFYSNEGGEPSISETESNIIALLEKYEKRTDLFQYHEQGGNETMPSINFKISDSQKFDFLFNLLNPNFNEEGGWMIEYCICDVYDEYAVVRNYAEGIFERVFYVKDDENDSLEITNKERCYIVDVNYMDGAFFQDCFDERGYFKIRYVFRSARNNCRRGT